MTSDAGSNSLDLLFHKRIQGNLEGESSILSEIT